MPLSKHYLLVFSNTNKQTFHLLDRLSRTERAEEVKITVYDPVFIKDTEDAMKTIFCVNPHKNFPWKYTQDSKTFQDASIDRVVFLGNFNKLEPKKVGWMMRNFVRSLKLNVEIKELAFNGTMNGLVQAECFREKYPDMATRIKCYSPEVLFGDLNEFKVYPRSNGDFYVVKQGKEDPDLERQVKELSMMTTKYHESEMWVQNLSQWMEGEDVTPPLLGRCPTLEEIQILKTGGPSVLFLPEDELDSEGAIDEKWLAAARDTHNKISDILKE